MAFILVCAVGRPGGNGAGGGGTGGVRDVAAKRTGAGGGGERKQAGYWQSQENVARELRKFQAGRGVSVYVMPTGAELRGAGRVDLYRGVQKFGGFNNCARILGFTPRHDERKEAGYWQSRENVARELRAFQAARGVSENLMPTATELRETGRVDLYRGVQRFGGFWKCARVLGLEPARHPRGYWRAALAPELRAVAVYLTPDTPMRMPTTLELRSIGRTDILNAVRAAGGVHVAATEAGLVRHKYAVVEVAKDDEKSAKKIKHSDGMNDTREREQQDMDLGNEGHEGHERHDVNSSDDEEKLLNGSNVQVEVEGGTLPEEYTDVRRRHQTEIVESRRETQSVITTVRKRANMGVDVGSGGGGVSLSVGADLQGRRRRGYWSEFEILEMELRTYTARHGLPGLMPRRVELRRDGRYDLVYAIMKFGGFSTVAAKLHLVWVGPCNFWRNMSNLRRRLMAFVRRNGPSGQMPSMQRLHHLGRTDLMHGVALHGGVMHVARRLNLQVKYVRKRTHTATGALSVYDYWTQPENVVRELREFLLIVPLQYRAFMPSSVTFVQAGRTDLANAIRDHGGWTYYALRLGLKLNLERKWRRFWVHPDNVHKELMQYVKDRYGDWDFPGVAPAQAHEEDEEEEQLTTDTAPTDITYVPSLEMLKRDGRPDIALAIQRNHGGEAQFFNMYPLLRVAEDTVQIQPVDRLRNWNTYKQELHRWTIAHGVIGTMPKHLDLIRAGRHDLRYATLHHGGTELVASRCGLILCNETNPGWLHAWLGLMAGRLQIVLSTSPSDTRAKFQSELEQPAVRPPIPQTQPYRLHSAFAIRTKRKRNNRKRALALRKKMQSQDGEIKEVESAQSAQEREFAQRREEKLKNVQFDRLSSITEQELEQLRARYQHMVADDIIKP